MLEINAPCAQNFAKMPINGNGRYCNSCEKTVVDFTNFSEVELLNYFRIHKNVDVCGRVKASQLGKQNLFESFLFKNKQFILSKVNIKPLRIVLLGLISGLLTFTTSCMGKVMPAQKSTALTKDSLQTKNQNPKKN